MKKYQKPVGNFMFVSRLLVTIKVSLLCGLLLVSSAQAQQATGGIRGVATDKDFEVPLAGVKVTVAETGAEALVDESGHFMIQGVPAGSYTLIFRKDGYDRVVKSGVVVGAGQMGEVEAALPGSYEDMDEFVVRDIELGGSSEMGLLNLRMDSASMMDSVGAEMMSKAGASDAAGALKLVSGATVQDGKYAVVRGLPDRYVSSQMNGVVLPTADPDVRAVQLDQFPSAVIESMQVSKTFTPDQQGSASGGAVNVVLKGVPEENVFKVKVGSKYKSNLDGADFLSYEDAGLGRWGMEADQHKEQPSGEEWDGAVGVCDGDVPNLYDASLTLGGKKDLFSDWKVGGLANLYYKRDASYYDDGVDDSYYWNNTLGQLVPSGITGYSNGSWTRDEDSPENTSLYDVTKSVEEVQWGGLGVVGIENDWNKLKLLYMTTHSASDTVVLAEDTRGHDLYTEDTAYRRWQTLEYEERDTDIVQFSGEHTIPFPDVGVEGWFKLLNPEIDWTFVVSSSSLETPDERMFGAVWLEESTYTTPDEYIWGIGFVPGATYTNAAQYKADLPAEGVGNFSRVWTEIEETSEQYFSNIKFPFENWAEKEGYLKFGLFNDSVDRDFDQRNYSNYDESWAGNVPGFEEEWRVYWSDADDPLMTTIYTSPYGASYDATQTVSAWYWMGDLPLCSFFKIVGGTRYEKTKLEIEFEADEDTVWFDREANTAASLAENPPDEAGLDQVDVLPAMGFELSPLEQLVFRANYSMTIARPTFKEISPVSTQEYAGGDVFVGNPELQMSSLKNYDLRADWTPYPGGLVSVSWFKKKIEDPIEYTQADQAVLGEFITAVNYPDGTMEGYEFEVRQDLGHFSDLLTGFAAGANFTLIDSEVTISDDDVGGYYNDPDARDSLKWDFVETTRDMMNAPEHLYNVYLTYDIDKTRTKLGLFYTVTGDTLVAGSSTSGEDYVPNVYAKEYGTLNFTLSQKFGENWTMGFKAKNLTNPKIQAVSRSEYVDCDDEVKTSYTKGIEVSVSLRRSW